MGALAIGSHTSAQVVLQALDAPDTQNITPPNNPSPPSNPVPPNNPFTPSEKCLERVRDKYYGDGDHNFIYCAVQGPNGKKWLNLNLGAEYAKEGSPHFNPEAIPENNKDWKAFGSLFQYGRKADGHELVTYHHTSLGNINNPTADVWYVNRKYDVTTEKQNDIHNTNRNYVWGSWWFNDNYMRQPNVFNNLWGEQAVNDPCPNGYRLANTDDILQIFRYGSIEIFGGFQNTSVFRDTRYPNLYIVTGPGVESGDTIIPNGSKTNRFQKTGTNYTDTEDSTNNSSGLLLGDYVNYENTLSNLGGRFVWERSSGVDFWQGARYFEPGFKTPYLDRGVLSTNMVYRADYGWGNHEIHVSLPVRCVEK